MKKRFLSLILAAVLIITGVVPVFAEDLAEETPSEAVTGEIITMYDYNHYKEYDVIVLCYDSKYSVKGEVPTVNLDVYLNSSKTTPHSSYPLPSKSVSQEVFVHEGISYPQLFITVPIEFLYKDSRTHITIQEGVFLTEDGEKCGETDIVYTSLKSDNTKSRISLSCKSDNVTDAGSKPVKILQNSTVTAEGTFEGEYAKIWAANAKYSFYHMDTAVESTDNTVILEGEGNYKVRFSLNDQLYTEKSFQSISMKNRYLENLKEKTEAFLLAPFALIVGIGLFIFIPGFGTWIGSTSMLASVYAIPNFFIALFGANLSGEYVF